MKNNRFYAIVAAVSAVSAVFFAVLIAFKLKHPSDKSPARIEEIDAAKQFENKPRDAIEEVISKSIGDYKTWDTAKRDALYEKVSKLFEVRKNNKTASAPESEMFSISAKNSFGVGDKSIEAIIGEIFSMADAYGKPQANKVNQPEAREPTLIASPNKSR